MIAPRIRLTQSSGVGKPALDFSIKQKIPTSLSEERLPKTEADFFRSKGIETRISTLDEERNIHRTIKDSDGVLTFYPGSHYEFEVRTTKRKGIDKLPALTPYFEQDYQRDAVWRNIAKWKKQYFAIDTKNYFNNPNIEKKVNEFVDFLKRNNIKDLYITGSDIGTRDYNQAMSVTRDFLKRVNEKLEIKPKTDVTLKEDFVKEASISAYESFMRNDPNVRKKTVWENKQKIEGVPFIEVKGFRLEGKNDKQFYTTPNYKEGMDQNGLKAVVEVYTPRENDLIATWEYGRLVIHDDSFFNRKAKTIKVPNTKIEVEQRINKEKYNFKDVVISSGGQIGIDRIALEEAREAGFKTGGQAPGNYWTLNGKDPTLKEFGLTAKGDYKTRTKANVKNKIRKNIEVNIIHCFDLELENSIRKMFSFVSRYFLFMFSLFCIILSLSCFIFTHLNSICFTQNSEYQV